MKCYLFLCFLFESYCAISQNNPSKGGEIIFPEIITSHKTYGYIGGVRLDSIDAQYATIDRGGSQISFDYGQFRDRKKELTVTDNRRKPLEFASTSVAFALNFFYFNGWQLTLTHYTAADKENTLILEKRK